MPPASNMVSPYGQQSHLAPLLTSPPVQMQGTYPSHSFYQAPPNLSTQSFYTAPAVNPVSEQTRYPRPPPRPSNRPILCYRCGEYGHYQSKCALPEGSPSCRHCPEAKDLYSKDCPKQRASTSTASNQGQSDFTFPKINMISVSTIPHAAPSTHVVIPQDTKQTVEEPVGVLTRSQRAALGLKLPECPPSSSEVQTSTIHKKGEDTPSMPENTITAPLQTISTELVVQDSIGPHTETDDVLLDVRDSADLDNTEPVVALGLGKPMKDHRRGKKSPLQQSQSSSTSLPPSDSPAQPKDKTKLQRPKSDDELPFEELPQGWLQETYADFKVDQTPAHDISLLHETPFSPPLSTTSALPSQEPVKEVTSFMLFFKDVFAWKNKDLEGIPPELGIHTIPLVCEAVGLAISIAGGNVEAHNVSRNDGKVGVLDLKAVTSLDVTDWKAFITSQTLLDTVMCQRVSMQANAVLEQMENVLPASNTGSNAQDISDLQKAVRFTETDVRDARDEVWSFVRPVVSENMQIATMRPFSLHEDACVSVSSGIISLIPKGGDASTMRQWRPITLMSSDRNILDNVVTFYETVEWARLMEQPTVIMLLDFEKAYDRVDWGVLEGTLSRMGFPDAWMQGIFELYRSASAAVTIGGHVRRSFTLS
ncbi:hypothetical protein L7F22_049551 [Adiantum nelumboides]|nr:hypothetical protein [Adiantum nelumboides]